MNYHLIFLTLIFSFLQGCAVDVSSGVDSTKTTHKYDVRVDAINDPDVAEKTTYMVFPAYDNVDINSLQYKEYEAYVDKALTKAGFKKVTLPLTPSIVIFLEYNVKQTDRLVHEREAYYLSSIAMTAFDYDELVNNENEVAVWKTSISSKSKSNDLRSIFPVLLAPSPIYIGKNTRGIVELTISDNDDRVLELRGTE